MHTCQTPSEIDKDLITRHKWRDTIWLKTNYALSLLIDNQSKVLNSLKAMQDLEFEKTNNVNLLD